MKKQFKNAIAVSDIDGTMRNLHVSYQKSRTDLVKLAKYFEISSLSSGDDYLSELYQIAFARTKKVTEKMSAQRRQWEDSLLLLCDVEETVVELNELFDKKSSLASYERQSTQLRVVNHSFGIDAVLQRLTKDILGVEAPVTYLYLLFSQAYHSEHVSSEIDTTFTYLQHLIRVIKHNQGSTMSIEDIVNYIQVIRYIQDIVTVRSNELFD